MEGASNPIRKSCSRLAAQSYGTLVPQLDKTAEALVFFPSACLAAAGTVEASQQGENSA